MRFFFFIFFGALYILFVLANKPHTRNLQINAKARESLFYIISSRFCPGLLGERERGFDGEGGRERENVTTNNNNNNKKHSKMKFLIFSFLSHFFHFLPSLSTLLSTPPTHTQSPP